MWMGEYAWVYLDGYTSRRYYLSSHLELLYLRLIEHREHIGCVSMCLLTHLLALCA